AIRPILREPATASRGGCVAQRESTSFTPRGSQVQSLSHPPSPFPNGLGAPISDRAANLESMTFPVSTKILDRRNGPRPLWSPTRAYDDPEPRVLAHMA